MNPFYTLTIVAAIFFSCVFIIPIRAILLTGVIFKLIQYLGIFPKVSETERIVAEMVTVFGEFPVFETGRYTFIADYLPTASGDAMEHRNSTVLSSPGALRTRHTGLLGAVSHEFFHVWNVERIRPRSLEPFDFEDVNPSDELWLAEGKKLQDKLWGRAQVALMRMGIDANQVASVVGQRDVESLAKLVSQADAGTAAKSEAGPPGKIGAGAPQVTESRTIRQMQAEKAAEGGYNSLEEPNLKRALRAFRKKLKTLRRDDESRLGNRYVTSGKPSSITAITPPNEYPTPVWSKLVELGRLKRAGKGTFELP